MTTQNLWGELPNVDDVRTPTTILKEQAAQLSAATKAVLRGRAAVTQSSGWFLLQLRIVAPVLDNYEYTVLDVAHGVDPYPLTLTPIWNKNRREGGVRCNTEVEFLEAVAAVLQDDRTRRVVGALLAQSKAMSKDAG